MRSIQPHRIALAVGAAILIGWQTPVHASIIKYDYTGIFSGTNGATCRVPITCGTTTVLIQGNTPFSGNFVVDTTTGSLQSFHFDFAGFGIWEGSGGQLARSATSFNLRVGTSAGATYTAKGLNGATMPTLNLNEGGTSARFTDFVDGYATTFNVAGMGTRTGILQLGTAWSGVGNLRIDTLAGTVQPTATVDAPGTVALAGLAGLAALGAARRRKAAAAA